MLQKILISFASFIIFVPRILADTNIDKLIENGKIYLLEANYEEAIDSFKKAKHKIEEKYQPLPISWTDKSPDAIKIEKYTSEIAKADKLLEVALEFKELNKRINGEKPSTTPKRILDINISTTEERTPLNLNTVKKSVESALKNEFSEQSLLQARKEISKNKGVRAIEFIGIPASAENQDIFLNIIISPDFSLQQKEELREKQDQKLKPVLIDSAVLNHKSKNFTNNDLINKILIFFGLVKTQELWGYQTEYGNKEIISPELYEKAEPFVGKYAFVKKEERWGMIDREFNYIIEPKYYSRKEIEHIKQTATLEYESKKELESILIDLQSKSVKAENRLKNLATGRQYRPSFSHFGVLLADQGNPSSISWLQKGAENDDPIALNKLGELYEDGKIVDKNTQKARQYYEKASDLGYAPALAKIFNCFYKGIGGPKNLDRALQIIIKAEDCNVFLSPSFSDEELKQIQDGASKNNPYCQYILAQKYELGAFNADGSGYRIEPDLQKAADFYEKAAKNGLPKAYKKYAEVKLK
jgi:hypothetical protein